MRCTQGEVAAAEAEKADTTEAEDDKRGTMITNRLNPGVGEQRDTTETDASTANVAAGPIT